MRFSMLYSGEQILSFKLCLVFYARNSLNNIKFCLENPFITTDFVNQNGKLYIIIFKVCVTPYFAYYHLFILFFFFFSEIS